MEIYEHSAFLPSTFPQLAVASPVTPTDLKATVCRRESCSVRLLKNSVIEVVANSLRKTAGFRDCGILRWVPYGSHCIKQLIPQRVATGAMASANCRNHLKCSHLRFVLAGLIVVLPGVASAQSNSVAFSDLVSKAAAARIENDLPRAIQLYSQAVQMNPNWTDGWWYLG